MPNESQPDLWNVRFASGEIKTLTLDELDRAYDTGLIDESTPVLRAGELRWSTLGAVAGIEPPEPMPLSVAPVALDRELAVDLSSLDDVPAELRPKRRAGKVFGVLVAAAAMGGVGFAATHAPPGLAASVRGFVTSHVAGARPPAKAAAAEPVTPAAPVKAVEPPEAAPPPEPKDVSPPAPPAPIAAAAAARVPTLRADELPSAGAKTKTKAKPAKARHRHRRRH